MDASHPIPITVFLNLSTAKMRKREFLDEMNPVVPLGRTGADRPTA
jgi:hypothetical protein